MHRKIFTLCTTIVCLMFVSCEKNEFDASDVTFEVSIENLGRHTYQYYEILCSGSLGGFTGEAIVRVKGYGSKIVNVTSARTPYSFTFLRDRYSWGGNRPTYMVEVVVGDKVVMSTSVVER